MIKYKNKILIFTLSLLSSSLLIGCNSDHVQQSTVNSDYTYTEKNYEDHFESLSKALNIKKENLEDKLTLEDGERIFKLIPAKSLTEDLNFYKKLVVYGDEEYTKLYFQNKKMKNERQAESYYNSCMNDMWKKHPPDSYFFIILLNNKPAGIISTSNLISSNEVTIGYITEQNKSNQGIATNALKILLDFLKYMKSNNTYNYSKLALWIFDENSNSIKVAEKNNFKLSEKNENKQMSKFTIEI